MGRATRWLKGMLGVKMNHERNINENSNPKEYKSWWCSGHWVRDAGVLCQNPITIPPNITPAEAAWLRSFYSEPDDEQKQHARAVAAATAAAADAAVAAARAAAVVVRLTSQGRGAAVMFGTGSREKWAAVKIQSGFRGYLARKALRALKGLVKLQAVTRGFLVRKRAEATLYSMQVLIRAQANVRATRKNESYRHPQIQARKSLDKFDKDTSSSLESRRLSASFEAIKNAVDERPKIVEVDTTWCRPKSRSSWWSNTSEQEWRYFCSAQSSPRLESSKSATPTKSLNSYAQNQNYMANTDSFKAKLRSQSAPKLRPDQPWTKRTYAGFKK